MMANGRARTCRERETKMKRCGGQGYGLLMALALADPPEQRHESLILKKGGKKGWNDAPNRRAPVMEPSKNDEQSCWVLHHDDEAARILERSG